MEEQQTQQEDMAADNVSDHKAVAVIGYIIPLLFFIPMLSDAGKKSTFAMFHANQQLNLLLASFAIGIINIIPILGQIVWLIGSVAIFVFAIMGIISAVNGTMKELPLIGKYKLLK